ncbi:MAG: topoisomerase subunit [Candidatus Methanomethylophilaceae archaeon]|nr:topoisomerase subunit [Candidatus Methanomethylophilaceae archaeon]
MHSEDNANNTGISPMKGLASTLAGKQQEISITEFFEKNKHILGFDSQSKALLIGIKEAVDNALDACEEAGVLPEISVLLERTYEEDEFHVVVEDNGPGIVHHMMPNVFGRLLFGSRFHARRQSRGQQGIGISATVMYGNITTGKPARVMSKTDEDVAWVMDISVDTKKNRPEVSNDQPFIWPGKDHGTRIEYYIRGRYVRGKQSVFEYLKNTAIVNPHARLTYTDPDGKKYVFERATSRMPPKAREVKPHIQGLEIGDIMHMARETKQKTVRNFLKNDFSRITDYVANEILYLSGIDGDADPASIGREQARDLLKAVANVKIRAPPTDCLSPIGEELIKKGLKHVLEGHRPEYYAPPVTRSPTVVNGNPLIVEAGIVYGGELPSDSQVTILRFANRVPLLYQQGACAITKAVESIDWRNYGLEQRGGKGIPFGPAIILVHIASTKVPFTSEGKEAVANIEEIQKEISLALKLCGRHLKSHLNKKEKKKKTRAKFEVVQEILPQIAEKSANILGKPVPDLSRTITKIMNVIWVEPFSQTDKEGLRHIHYQIYNYTNKAKSFMLHSALPRSCLNESILSENLVEVKEDGKTTWQFLNLAPSESVELYFQLDGEMADVFDETAIFMSGLDPAMIIGADPLPGDWGIKGMEINEIEATVKEEVEEEVEEEIEEEAEEEIEEEELDDDY